MPTGQTGQIEKRESLSAVGSNAGRGGVAASHQGIPEWLARRSPEEVDSIAVSRALQRNVRLTEAFSWDARYDEEGMFLGSSAKPAGFTAQGSAEDKLNALLDLMNLMTPARPEQIEAWLAELSVIAPRRVGDEFEEALRLSAYTRRLGEYPADVVRYALIERPWRFFPSWAELDSACKEVVTKRKAMMAALEREDRKPSHRREERRDPISAKRASEIVAEIYGDTLKGGGA